MAESNWKFITIPRALVDEIDALLPDTTYPNRSQFIAALIRRAIEDIRK